MPALSPALRLRHAGLTELQRLLSQHLDGKAHLDPTERDAVAWLVQERMHRPATTVDAPAVAP